MLSSILAAYRTSPHTALDGMSPYEIFYGRKPVLPCDVNLPKAASTSASATQYKAEFQQRVQKIQLQIQNFQKVEEQKAKERFDQLETQFHFNEGDPVYLNVLARKKGSCKKLEPLFKGPYVTTKRIGEVDYAIQLLNSKNKTEHIVH